METHYFALFEPYSYQKLQQRLNYFEEKVQHSQNVYFHRELLCFSNEGRRVEMVTMTALENIPGSNQMTALR